MQRDVNIHLHTEPMKNVQPRSVTLRCLSEILMVDTLIVMQSIRIVCVAFGCVCSMSDRVGWTSICNFAFPRKTMNFKVHCFTISRKLESCQSIAQKWRTKTQSYTSIFNNAKCFAFLNLDLHGEKCSGSIISVRYWIYYFQRRWHKQYSKCHAI